MRNIEKFQKTIDNYIGRRYNHYMIRYNGCRYNGHRYKGSRYRIGAFKIVIVVIAVIVTERG